jgi:hypothetical protein
LKYFDKGSLSPVYTKSGDIEASFTKEYAHSGDIKTIVGEDILINGRMGDIWATVLPRPAQTRVAFEFDVETELT